MTVLISDFSEQLKETCINSNASWCVVLHYQEGEWILREQIGIDQQETAAFIQYVHQAEISEWLLQAFTIIKPKWRKTEHFSNQRVYFFPHINQKLILAVGATKLSKEARGFFSILMSHAGVIYSSALHGNNGALGWPLDPEIEAWDDVQVTEIGKYLQYFTLLAELASGLSAGMDADDVARSIVKRLKDVFRTDLAAILLHSGDGVHLREYGVAPDQRPLHFSIELSLAGYVLETGAAVCYGDVRNAPRFLDENRGVQSALMVPLKYRSEVVGVIAIESLQRDAFMPQDEQILSVVASNLAGLLKNVQLNQETRDYARNLTLIHRVVLQVIGLTDLSKISRLAAELIAEYFKVEFAVVLMLDETENYLINMGVGGSLAHSFELGYRYPVSQGITGRVARTGQSVFLQDASKDPVYFTAVPWSAGSEICVPLKYGDRTFGVINLEKTERNSFSENDLQIFESLAGILASVMMNARRYEELHRTVSHLQAARETALDLSGSLEQEALFKRVVHRALELTKAKGAELGLIDEKRQVVRIVISESPWVDLEEREIPFNKGVTGHIAVTGEALRVSDYPSWSGRIETDGSYPFSTIAGVPLKLKNKVIGTLVVMDDTPEREFQEDELQLLDLLAPQVAVSFQNAQLYQELQERIDAQHQAEIKLLRSARLAAVGEMAAGVAHELNNPLTTVTGFVELALEELPPEFIQKTELNIVLNEALRAREVVRRLLNFARKTDQIRLPTDINRLVKDVLALVKHTAKTGGVVIDVDLAPDLASVHVDPNQIKQVLLNLVQNGLQSMPKGGSLRVKTQNSLRGEFEGVAIALIDSGHGIPVDIQDRIFDPFFTTRPVGAGTGLGLYISYGIVTEHGGYIDVDSKLGEGSCFSVWLPRIQVGTK